jgi:hypothetical protein
MVAFADLSLSFLFGLSSLILPVASSGFLDAGNVLRSTVCEQIATEVSPSSVVYYTGTYFKSNLWWQSEPQFSPGSSQYAKDNYHWSASSSQASECSFEPATAEDVGIAVCVKQTNAALTS